LQSGAFDKRPGFKHVRTCTTFGTPHNGAAIGLAGAVGKHKTNFLSIEQSMRLANDPRYPALYQLFPGVNEPVIWERTAKGRLAPHTLGDEAFVLKSLKLSPANYNAYLEFRTAIDNKPYPEGVRRFVLMGTRFATMTHFFWDDQGLTPVESKDGGDGTVSIQGAYVPDVQCRLTGQAHVSLIRADEARQTFQELMGARGMLAGAQQVEISTRDVVVGTKEDIHLVILAEDGLNNISGEIVIEGAPLPARDAPPPTIADFKPLARAPQPFSYAGPSIASATLTLPGIPAPGFYRVVVKSAAGANVAQSPVFAVNSTQ
jgi:hypothetical protein